MKASNYRLCYMENRWDETNNDEQYRLYFTDDFKNTWGDDWADIPYDLNAGPPYTTRGNVVYIDAMPSTCKTFVFFITPEGASRFNSVENINAGLCPWLFETVTKTAFPGGMTLERALEKFKKLGIEVRGPEKYE